MTQTRGDWGASKRQTTRHPSDFIAFSPSGTPVWLFFLHYNLININQLKTMCLKDNGICNLCDITVLSLFRVFLFLWQLYYFVFIVSTCVTKWIVFSFVLLMQIFIFYIINVEIVLMNLILLPVTTSLLYTLNKCLLFLDSCTISGWTCCRGANLRKAWRVWGLYTQICLSFLSRYPQNQLIFLPTKQTYESG